MDRHAKRRATMIAKYGSEEAYFEHYRTLQKKSRENYNGMGGFGAGEEGKKRASEAGKKRWLKQNL